MRKIAKIVVVVVALAIIGTMAGLAVAVSDIAGSLATGSKPLPNGAAVGKALIVYDPGLSGGARDIATKIGYGLQSSGYDVMLAGVKSSAAADIDGYDIIVVGGPIYGGKPAGSIQSYLEDLNPPENATVGVFGYGSVKIDNSNTTAVKQDVVPLPGNNGIRLSAVMKIASGDDADSMCSDFVSALLK